jgi:acetylglutamate kinase
VGLSGVDGSLVTAERRPPQEVEESGKRQRIDYGFVGDVVSVNVQIVCSLLDKEFVPVISSLAADEAGVLYSIDADTVASAIASDLRCEKLILAGNVDGIYDGTGASISRLTPAQAQKLISNGVIKEGMVTKVESSIRALRSEVKSVHVINGTKADSLLEEVFTEKGVGTMIYDDLAAIW